MANTKKKNNTKKEANKPEIKEEIVEIKKEIVEELEELTDETKYDEEITNFLEKQGLDDQTIEKVLYSEELGNFVEALMKASNEKPSLKERAKAFATNNMEAIKTSAIVIGITGAIVGVTYAVCSVADDDVDEYTSNNHDYDEGYIDDEGKHHAAVVDDEGKEYDLITQVVPKEAEEA